MSTSTSQRLWTETAPSASTTLRPRTSTGLLSFLVVVVVVGQRIALPAGGQVLPLALVACYAVAAVLLWRGSLRCDRLRLELFVVAAAACAVATYAATVYDADASPSVPSLLLLLVLYALWVLRVAEFDRAAYEAVLRTFVRVMLVLSVVGVVQMAAQYAGVWAYEDYLLRYLPSELLVPDYNTSAPTAYESPIYRGNAFVFLEPSFLSQFSALAVLIALLRRAPAWQVGVLVGGLLSAVSGTGFLLLGAGLAVLTVRARRALRPGYVALGIAAVGALLLTPFADGLLGRVEEFGRNGSSASLRFVQPYTETLSGLDREPSRFYVGAGPGASERLLLSDRGGALGAAVTYTTAPKLTFEYGLGAGGLFMLFLVVALFRRAPLPVLPASLFVMTWILSGALLQPHTTLLVWLLSVLWPKGGPAVPLR